MAFTTKQFNDLQGILILMLLTIPSIVTTNIDCNGKPFHCLNSTHFMICVDLGGGVSSTIDSFIIPCPAPTECRGTNRFECEFPAATTQPPINEPLGFTTDPITIATIQAIESRVQVVPEITTVSFEDLYNTVSTSTLKGIELSTPNPTFINDSTAIDVIDNVNVSTFGSHADLEVGGSTDILNITSSTQDVFSETTVSPVITDFTVANTTEKAINFTQTDGDLNAVNTINLDIAITMTEHNEVPTFTTTERVNLITENKTETDINSISEKQLVTEITMTVHNEVPIFTTTERVNLITENKTETDINSISEKQLVTESINITSSIQNHAKYTTESQINNTQVDNNGASITEITLDQPIIASDQDQLRSIDMAKKTTVTITNPLGNELINAENTTKTLNDFPGEHIVTDADTKQTTQIYATTETLEASSKIVSDLSIATESIVLVEPNTLIENNVLVDQEKQFFSVDKGTIETLRPISKINIEMSTQGATADYNLDKVALAINGSDVITGLSSELHDAIPTAPTIDTTLITETTTQEAFYFIKNTSVIPTSEVNATTDLGITYDNNNNIIDDISTISLLSTNSPTLNTDAKIVNTESSISEIKQNEIVVQSLETNLKTLPETLLTTVTIEKKLEFNPSVTEPAVSESYINSGSNVDIRSIELDSVLQQLEGSNKPNSVNNVSNLNSQHNILGNIDLNADKQDIKTITTTEPTFTETMININNNNINTRIQLVEDNSITLQREYETSKVKTIQTTDSSNGIVSDSSIIFDLSSLPILPTEPISYLDANTPEKAIKGPDVIESTAAGDDQLNSQDNKKNDSITSTRSSILPTEATTPYYDVTESNRKADQLSITSESNYITETTNNKAPDFNMDKIISELRKTGSKGQETLTTPQTEQTRTQWQETVEIILQTTATETIVYSPTIAADDKLISTESTIFEEQNKIKPTLVDTTSENQLPLTITKSVLKLNPTVTDSAVSESNLFFESIVNVQLPKAILTKTMDIIDKHNLNAPEIGSEKSHKVEPKGYETPMTEIQTQLREIEFNTHQQKETKSISSITRSTAEYDTISKLPVTESTRNIVNFNVPSRKVSSDSILQLTTSSVLENTEKINAASKVLDVMVSTMKSIVDNSPDFIENKDDNTNYYGTGDLTTSFPTISISRNKVQDHPLQTMASPQNQIVIPLVNSLKTMQYNPNNKLSEELTISQTPIEQTTAEFKFASQNNIENINENPQHKTPNTVANIVKNLEPNTSKKMSFKKESVNKPSTQETNVPILEKTAINLTPSSVTEIQEIVPDIFRVVTDNIGNSIINHEVQPEAVLESANNNKDLLSIVTIGITKNGPSPPVLSSTGDFSTQNTYINKHIIIKQEGPHVKENVLNELNNTVVNEENRTSADITNHTSTSYSDTRGKILPTKYATGSNPLNSFGEFNNNTSTKNYSNLVTFMENNTSASTFVGKNIDQNSNVRNDINLSEADTIQSRNKLDHSIGGLVKTAPTQTSDVKIMLITTGKTPVTNIFNREKDQALNSETGLTATQTLESQQTVGGDSTVSNVSKNNGTENIYSSIGLSKDQKNGKKSPEARVKSLAERDISTTSNKSSTIQIDSTSSNSQMDNNNAGEAINLVTFDLLLSAKSGGFEDNNNKPLTEKPDDEETIASGNEGENHKINKDSSFTTSSSETVSVTTESVEGGNNENNDNNIVQSNSKYETLSLKPTIEISTRPTQVDNLKNIQLPIVSEVSTQSTVRSTSQKLSLENNTPLPATTKAVTNDFVCKFNQRGRFADKHDCRKFYICHGTPQPLEGICPVYTVFSELRKQCTKNLSHCVRNNQFQCVSEGRFSDFLNDNIYYICAKNTLSTFIRFKLRCQNGYHLNKTSVRCVLNTESSQSISSDISKSNSEQSAALKVEVKSKDSSKKKLECKEEGTFADPDNCRVYYVCKKTSKSGYLRKKKKCDSDEYFHKDKKKCVDAESYECK